MRPNNYYDDDRDELFNDHLQNWVVIFPKSIKIEAVSYDEALERAIELLRDCPEKYIDVEGD